MKSFKEFLMEEDEQNNNDQDFEILNSLKDFLENFDTKKDDSIDQEIIVKYLICKSLIKPKKNFKLATEKYNKSLQSLKSKCENFFNVNNEASGNSDLGDKLDAVYFYIKEKYNKTAYSNLLLNLKDVVITENTTLDKFLSQAEEKIKQKLEAAKADNPVDNDHNGGNPPPANSGNDHNGGNGGNDDNDHNGGNPPPANSGNDDNDHNGGNSDNNENYGTTRQGSYLGRFTSAQMEDIMSGNEDKIANALGVMAKAAKDRCDELLSQVKEKVEKNSKYLKEEKIAQKVLWESIFNRLPKQEKLKIQKQHGTKSIYKDEDNQKLTEIINKYKAQIDNLVKTTVDNCQPLGEKLHAFSTSAKMEDKLKEQLRMNVRNFTNKLYDITLEVEKASRKSGFFENKKIEKGSKKEEEWNNFKNSEKGENFDRRASERTEVLKKELSKILPNIQKASNDAEVSIKIVSKLIKDSTNANDFFNKAVNYTKIFDESGRKISVLEWLQKKGIPIPVNKEINDKYSKDLTVTSWNELFKDKEFLNSLSSYGENWKHFKAGYGNLRTLEDFERFRDQFGKDFEAEINYYCKKFIKLEKQKGNGTGGEDSQEQKNNNGTGGEDSQEQKTKTQAELAAEYIRKNGGGFPSVTSNSCDGLPIGARKYSKAVRRRMNYALNKYL